MTEAFQKEKCVNYRTLKIVSLIATHIQLAQAVVHVQAPAELTVPLRVKVYGVNKDKPFLIEDYEKPTFFRSFDNDTIVNKYSWKYISRARKDELGYVLLGYEERDKDDLKKAGADLWDATKNQLTEPPPPPAPAAAPTPPATPGAAPAPGAPTPPTPSATPPPTGATPGQPVPAATPASTGATPKPEAPPTPAAPAQPTPAKAPAKLAQKAKPKPVPAEHPKIPGDTKTLLLELNMVCTNMPGIELTDDQIEMYLPGGKVYGKPIDLTKHKNCYYVAKKYKNDAPAPEIREWLEKIYGAILGPGGSLDMEPK